MGKEKLVAVNEKLLLDTNVWLDFFDVTRPGNAVATAFIERMLERGHMLLYALGSAKDTYYVLEGAAKRTLRAMYGGLSPEGSRAAEGFAWDCICTLRSFATCVGADESDLWLAEKSHIVHRDFEDDLVIAAAQRSGADVLVTSDAALLAHAPVAAMTPADALAYYGTPV